MSGMLELTETILSEELSDFECQAAVKAKGSSAFLSFGISLLYSLITLKKGTNISNNHWNLLHKQIEKAKAIVQQYCETQENEYFDIYTRMLDVFNCDQEGHTKVQWLYEYVTSNNQNAADAIDIGIRALVSAFTNDRTLKDKILHTG